MVQTLNRRIPQRWGINAYTTLEKLMFVRNNYNYDANEASQSSALICDDELITQQHFLESSDINRMVAQYGRTGEAIQTTRQPLPEDFYNITDYHTALNAVKAGDAAFMTLPANVRERFNNSTGQYLAFLEDEKNRDEAVALGLVNKPWEPDTPTAQPLVKDEAQ